MSALPNLCEIAVSPHPPLDRLRTVETPLALAVPAGRTVGRRGRQLFSSLKIWRRARRPRIERLYWRYLKPAFAAALILWYTPRYAAIVRRRYGVSVFEQIV